MVEQEYTMSISNTSFITSERGVKMSKHIRTFFFFPDVFIVTLLFLLGLISPTHTSGHAKWGYEWSSLFLQSIRIISHVVGS